MRAERGGDWFETVEDIVKALKRYRDIYDPKSGSFVFASKSNWNPTSSPFRGGFLEGLDQRDELLRRMCARLPERERLLLLLWYVADWPVPRIAKTLKLSRMHCYRLKKAALGSLIDEPEAVDWAEEDEAASWR